MSKLAVVTGGAGFIGSHLCERLVSDGYKVISLDNYFTGLKENHVDGVEYREGHTKDIAKHVSETPDVLFHLGEYSRVAPSLKEPEVVFGLNVLGTFGVLEFWREKKCKLVYAGSSTRFADSREDGVAGHNRAPYSYFKYSNSELVKNYANWYDLSYSTSYFYNVYGPGERAGQFDGGYGTLIETFKQCYFGDGVCTINGTGEQTRAFTHVADTVSALMLIAERGTNDEYAISAKEVHSLLDVAKMFDLEITFAPATKSTRSNTGEATTKLDLLGWEQKHTLKGYIDSIKK